MILALLFWGCTSLVDDSGEEPSLNWTWLSADTHVHSSLGSNDTDGLGLDNVLETAMRTAGLDIVWITDHSNSQGSMECVDVEDCPNQGPEITSGDWPSGVWLGSEISPWAGDENSDQATGHIGCLPIDGVAFDVDHFVDRPVGTVTGGDAVQQCIDGDGFAILAHPFGPTSWVSFDWSTTDFHAMEIFNGGAGFDPSDAKAVEAWQQGRADGYPWIPVGGSDSHHWGTEAPGTLLQSALGWPRTELGHVGTEAPIDALRQGRTIVSDGNTHLRLFASAKGQVVGPGERMAGPFILHVEALTEEPNMRLQVLRLPDFSVLDLALDATLAHHCLELAEPGLYIARVWPEEGANFMQRGFGLTNTIELF